MNAGKAVMERAADDVLAGRIQWVARRSDRVDPTMNRHERREVQATNAREARARRMQRGHRA
jgi:hypothetical protein